MRTIEPPREISDSRCYVIKQRQMGNINARHFLSLYGICSFSLMRVRYKSLLLPNKDAITEEIIAVIDLHVSRRGRVDHPGLCAS